MGRPHTLGLVAVLTVLSLAADACAGEPEEPKYQRHGLHFLLPDGFELHENVPIWQLWPFPDWQDAVLVSDVDGIFVAGRIDDRAGGVGPEAEAFRDSLAKEVEQQHIGTGLVLTTPVVADVIYRHPALRYSERPALEADGSIVSTDVVVIIGTEQTFFIRCQKRTPTLAEKVGEACAMLLETVQLR